MLPSLQLVQPTTVAEASQALGDFGERAKVYAGGAELLLLLRQKLLEVEVLIDIKKIGELHQLSNTDNGLRIGACMTHQALADDLVVRHHAPAFADADSDPGTVLLVHNASVKVANYKGERQIPLDQFFHDMYATALRPNEILTEVEIPPFPGGMNSAYLRVHRYQRPTLGIAAAVTMTDGAIAECRLAVGCAGPKPLRLAELETKATGATVSEARNLFAEQKNYLRELLKPVSDLLGSADYKLYMTSVMLGDALERAARGNGAELNSLS
jgi:carbon-monoxide dehydrogenase medium subunit